MELVLGLLAYVSILGGVLWYAARSTVDAPIEPNPPRERPKRVYTLGDKVLAATAKRHGLRHDVDFVRGRAGELRIEIVAVPDGTNPERFEGMAYFPRSLGLELSVEQRGSVGGRGSTTIVSDAFDHDFAVDALHADQARALLSGSVSEAFHRAMNRSFRPKLDDEALEITVSARLGAERCAEAMTWLIDTAREILAARASLPRPALEQRVLDAFELLAQDLGGRVAGDVLSLTLEEGELSAYVDRVREKVFRTRVRLELSRPLAVNLQLGLETERSRFARFKQADIELGDARFDDTFVVFGDPEDEVKSALGEAVRSKLLLLEEKVDALTLTPTELRVSVEAAVSDRGELGELVDLMRAVAASFAPKKGQGAYR